MIVKQFNNNEVDARFYLCSSEQILPTSVSDKISAMVKNDRFNFKSTKVFYGDVDNIVVGMEKSDSVSLRHAMNKVMDIVKEEKYRTIVITSEAKQYKVIVEMMMVGSYSFNEYKSDKKQWLLETVYVDGNVDEKDIHEAVMVGNSINVARSLVDAPSITMYPETLAEKAIELGQQHGFDVEVKELNEIKELGMNAFLAVAQGSSKQPKLIVARYQGNKDSSEILGLVGKGVTYDSGGYSIKPTNSMVTMKSDMAGAAAVLSAISLIAQAKVNINVTVVIAACENMISGDGYKPGDIVKTMKGKTIFIGNTDAEGRVTLVDAVYYAIEKEKVSKVIDLATLTGAAIVSLGDLCAATFTNNQQFLNDYHCCASSVDEFVWQLPLQEFYRDDIKHHEADYINTASTVSGAPGSAAGAFLIEEFVEGKDWIHVDIAGPSHFSRDRGFYKKGASGYGVKTLYELAKKMSQ